MIHRAPTAPLTVQIIDGLQYPLDVADLGDAQLLEIPPGEGQELASPDVVGDKVVGVLAELEILEPRADLLAAPGGHLVAAGVVPTRGAAAAAGRGTAAGATEL